MKMRSMLLALVLVIALAAFASADTVLTFGPVESGLNEPAMPAGYGGFNWDSNWFVEGNARYDSVYGNTYGAPSGGGASNSGGVRNVSLNGSTFNFVGAAFTGWAGNNSAQWYTSSTVTVTGYNNGNLVGSVTYNLSTNSYAFDTANLNGVTDLVFSSDGDGRWFLMDDFTFNNTPEPGSIALLGTGLLGLAGGVRRKLGR